MATNNTGSKILLETGTNEIEILEFTINGNVFGINVAKVKEIMMPESIKYMPHSHPSVEGIFKPRNIVLTVINLPHYLGLDQNTPEKTLLIVTSFNQINVAFRVHTVEGIDRISWSDIDKPDRTIYGGTDGVATGIAQCENRLITILDFEKIVLDITEEVEDQVASISEKKGLGDRSSVPIVMAEDSILLSKMIVDCLHKAGFQNIIKFNNGQEAWEYLESIKDAKDLHSKVSCIITDIEMPKMDGHRLTKLVKSDNALKSIPLVIFSSLITDEMRIKGKQIGADEQLSKPEIGHLVDVVSLLIKE